MTSDYEFVIVGGGTVGCVLASRLSLAGHNVAIFEAGPENYSEAIMSPAGAALLHGTEAEYNYKSVPQPTLNGRQIQNFGGRLLSGSSGVNYGMWTRGHNADYDAWARNVGEERWSYSNLLKYFKKSETFHDRSASGEIHGFDGPISTIAGVRNYPLKTSVLTAFKQSGLEFNPDINSGSPLGVSPFAENWKNHQRQPAGLAYDLSKVHVFTNSTVARIEIGPLTKCASGIVLVNGETIKASKEVIVSCGAIKSPQLLMLSGIGPREHLESLGIRAVVDLPVGQNYHDHVSGTKFWKLKNPEAGLAFGSPQFNDPSYFTGNPIDWVATISIPDEELEPAANRDGTTVHELFGVGPRGHAEIVAVYAPVASAGTEFVPPFDGTHISTPVALLLPTSRGEITLSSTDPTADPVINPKYLDTEVDRLIMRAGVRAALRTMETPEALSFVEGETPPPGFPVLTSASSDADIDARIAQIAGSFFHSAGTAAMGSVVDTTCRVKDISRLRVCDASILPLPLTAHYQGKPTMIPNLYFPVSDQE